MSRTTTTSHTTGRRRRVATAAATALVAPLAVAAVATAGAGTAAAHGSVTDPPSRNYGCWERWGDDFQNPEMADLDPMCWAAWQADPSAMWNWNGLYRENVGGEHEAAIPDGQLCSGGRTSAGRYDALDTPGDWHTTDVAQQFELTLTDGAQHGADYLRVYVTKEGFDPTTDELGWDDLELVTETGAYAPAPEYRTDVDLTGREGRAVLYTIWQASHLDQSYYLCSDVVIGGDDAAG
ncbi:lytic polysaccharide monooxygenase auxiliary activity family 9 protein [Isoptericola sp. F-RaC21]|uniref:lytic polysaccharide monooxygenase auxiliary activity family 9 protein n=1 Tax=Isoptericola sp. F-RaC21 TaxID=3141452 RepID=UPI00315BF0C8